MEIRRFYDVFLEWLKAHGPSAIVAILIFIAGQWFISVLKRWMKQGMERRQVTSSIRPFLHSFVSALLQILLLIMVLQILSVRMTIFTALITSFGVAAGLALSGTLQNFTAGIIIILLKPFRVGDNIIAQGQDGIVESIEIFYTVITTFDNRTVIIPNSKVSNEVIVNISRQGLRRLEIEIKLQYKIDLERVQEVVLQTAHSSPDILDDPRPVIGVSAIEPDGYKLKVLVWANALQYNQVKLAFQKRLVDDLVKSGLQLPTLPEAGKK
jgi:small conductance mechanosensitive channel